MTVSYTAKVANSKGFACFLKLLFRWRGSIYKLIWRELLVFLAFYFLISGVYRFVLNDSQQRQFEKLAIYCEKYGNLIPVSFVLGFYVSIVVGRWWQQYICIPWIDTLAIWVNVSIRGEDEKERLLRRTIMRYTCLSITQCFARICPRVKKRFPTLDHFVEGGLLLENEKDIITEINTNVSMGAGYPTHWVPIAWATSLVARARAENKIKNDSVNKSVMDELNKIKDQCALLISYDWISVPLVYTQVVTLAVVIYFCSCLFGKQWLKHNVNGKGGEHHSTVPGSSNPVVQMDESSLDLFFPVFTVLQFFFYMGWLKVAESLLNPFGDDDDDFELNWITDRNLQVAYLIVDEMHHRHPEILKDQYWDEVVPPELPHTVASEVYKEGPPTSSTDKVKVSQEQGEIVMGSSVKSNLHLGFQDGGTTPDSKRRSKIIRRSSSRSNHSQMTHAGSSGKLNRIGSAFKRMISRDRNTPQMDGGENFGSLINIAGQPGQDAIPELDETMLTITSARKVEPRPTAQAVFEIGDGDGGKMASGSKSKLFAPPTSYDAMIGPANIAESEEEKDPLSDVTTICIGGNVL